MEKAKEAFNKVINIDPRDAQGYACMGMIHHYLGEMNDAITRYHEV
jgi:Tfp pilus assembly protein PilF